MKKQPLLLFCLMTLFSMTGIAQITEVYRQGFETGEPTTYTVVQGTAAPQSAVAAAGQRALKLSHTSTSATVMFDTIVLTNSAWQHFALEFHHINNVDPNTCQRPAFCGVIEIMRPGIDNDWIKVADNYYNISEGSYSSYFYDVGTFCSEAYDGWATNQVTNSMWKHERFDFDAFLGSQVAVGRKLLVRMTLMARTASGSSTAGWYVDDVVLRVSPDPIITPVLKMVDMPDAFEYPNSRGAHIAVDVTTSAAQGMNPDSIYVVYKVGSSETQHKMIMSPVAGVNGRYECRIPFEGYDTVMRWHLVARDATSNQNTATYPASSTAWTQYACVRGKSHQQNLVANVSTLAMSDTIPFPLYGDSRSEFVFDSALLRAAGYEPGAITSAAFMIAQAVSASQLRERFQISMANVPTTYTASTNGYFYPNFMKAVYDNPLTISPSPAGTLINFNLQDTFFYAGHDILVRITYDNASIDPGATKVRVMPVSGPTKKTVYVASNYANLGADMFDESSYSTNMFITNSVYRPHMLLTARKNQALTYDCGVAAMAYPNYTTAARAGVNDSVVVWLKNYGASPINRVTIYYAVDGGDPVAYTWNSSLAGGDSVRVRVSVSQRFEAGFHTIRAWVGDTIRVGSALLVRDHEPYNDTIDDEFIACAGYMSGVRQVGGANADFATLDNFLFSLERCGINGALTVKLADGVYDDLTLPNVPGLSATNTITFEPLNSNVTFRASATATMLVNLQRVAHVRFRNIGFVRPATATATQYVVRMASTSNDVRFENCWFADSGSTAVAALISSAGANQLYIDRCQFTSGVLGVDLTGRASDDYSSNNTVMHSNFAGQTTNAIKVLYQNQVVIDSNWMNNVTANASSVLLLQRISGNSRVVNNKIFTSHGAGAIGLAQLVGTASQPIIVANNMMVCDDDAQSIQLTTPVNLISATHTLFAYNSVRLNAPNRRNIAAVTLGSGSSTLNNLRVVNNVIVNIDANNIALSYDNRASSSTTVNHNVYFSASNVLNKLVNSTATSLTEWQTLLPADNASIVVEPTFLNATLVDLRAYNTPIRGCAMPLTEVTTDMFGTSRDATSPCAGALEFEALYYDFSIDSICTPEAEYCAIPATIPIQVVLRNAGISVFNPATSGTLTLHYRYGEVEGSTTVNCTVPANGTAVFLSNENLVLANSGQGDQRIDMTFWLTSSLDPNETNDTLFHTTLLRYNPSAPAPITSQVSYGAQATLTVTNGLVSWPVGVYNSGRMQHSQVYWYTDSLASTPFFNGETFVTPPIYDDTTFFVAQRRDMGLMKITEVQLSRTGTGVTNPLPSWFGSSTKMAVELTNVGDYPVNLANDTIKIISGNATYQKTFVLPSVTVQPGATLVLQFYSGTTTDSARTLYYPLSNSNGSPSSTMAFGIVYRDGGGVADAVAFNSIVTATQWTSEHIPAAVWTGTGLSLNSTTAGARRMSWPTNPAATPNDTKSYWSMASSSNVMTIGTTDEELMLYSPTVCTGDKARVTVTLLNRPTVDIAVESPVVADGCGLGDEPLTVTLRNYGIQASPAFTVHYTDGSGVVGTDVISGGLASGASMTHVFSQPFNMHAQSDTVYHLSFWVETVSGDFLHTNDTVRLNVTSLYTPLLPNLSSPQTCAYGQPLTMTPAGANENRETFQWYDKNNNYITTANSYTSEALYLPDTFYVKGVSLVGVSRQLGRDVTTNTANSTNNPSPYNTVRKYAKEQYLYTAAELTEAGIQPGVINSIAFYLDTLLGTDPTVTFSEYTISLGATTVAEFASSGNNWLPTAPYMSSTAFSFQRSDGHGWITHALDSAFVWDGTSNIVVQVCRSMTTARSAGLRTTYTAATNRVIFTNSNTSSVCGVTTAGTRNTMRPNIRFGQQEVACEGSAKQIVVTLTGVPQHEAALRWPDDINDAVFTSCSGNSVSVRVVNLGSQPLTSYQLRYRVDNNAWQSVSTTPSVNAGSMAVVPIALQINTPGRHRLQVAVTATGDVNASNDTVNYLIPVRFCAGDYTIGSNGQFASFTAAVDTLTQVGVSGAVRFLVASGVYNEKINLAAIDGVSASRSVTFRSATGTASDVVLRGMPSSAENYVLNINGASNLTFENMTIASAASGNYNNAVTLSNADSIKFLGSVIRVNGATNNANAVCVVVASGVEHLHFVRTVFDSGYYSIKSVSVVNGASNNLTVDSCTLTNFWYRGIDIDGINTVSIANSQIRSGVDVAARPLTGIYASNERGMLYIAKNTITLSDIRNGGKTGIYIKSCQGANATMDKVQIHNNMISIIGAGNNTDVSSGITLDGTAAAFTRYAEVYYNTVRLYTSDNKNTTTAFKSTANLQDVYVMNNVFSNFSTGYAYYVASGSAIVTSDYNDYYSTSTTRLAFWNSEMPTLSSLRTASSDDNGSVNIQPYFVANDNLHMTTSNLSGRGLYNAEIPEDIDGNTRPQIPHPTLGAHEYPMPAHDVSVAEIVHPVRTDDIVEGDTVAVVVSFYNNGSSTERNVVWMAELVGSSIPASVSSTIATINSQDLATDTAYLILPYGIIDSQTVRVTLTLAGDLNDENNVASSRIYITPAFNLNASVTSVSTGTPAAGCNLQNAVITMTLRNVGRKPITTSMPLTIGYDILLQTEGVNMPQFPIHHTENLSLATDLAVNDSRNIDFVTTANLYPQGLDSTISVRIRSWVNYEFDLVPANDTTAYITKQSHYTPRPPVGTDLHIPYATTDVVWASQINERPIRWYRDSTQSAFYSPSNYTSSTHYNNLPQLFRDTVLYLNCRSEKNCPSAYSEVHIILNPRVASDVSAAAILSPSTGHVYVDRDTVTVRIANYSNRPISNIPVTYRFISRDGSTYNTLTEVTEVYAGPLAVDATVDYAFDSMVVIPDNYFNTAHTYRIEAWTALPEEMVPQNDTVRLVYQFQTRPEGAYCTPQVNNNDGRDITRIAFGDFDWEMPAVGRGYTNMSTFGSPETGSIIMPYSLDDTLTIEVANSEDCNDFESVNNLFAYIDYNRDGVFDTVNERVCKTLITTGTPYQVPLQIPEGVVCGYMKARFVITQDTTQSFDTCVAIEHGHVVDMLLLVEKDIPTTDIAAARVVTPRNRFINGDPLSIGVTMVNKGASTINAVSVHYSLHNLYSDSTFENTVNYPVQLPSGTSTMITLPAYTFLFGTTEVMVVITTNGDARSYNDTLYYEYHRPFVKMPTIDDHFDGPSIWYAPKGYNVYSQNYWQLGTPTKNNIDTVVSEPNAWVTNLTDAVRTGRRGSLSYLYSPIIDISQIRADSIAFLLAKNLLGGSRMVLEYYDISGNWVPLNLTNPDDFTWFDEENGWSGSSENYGYVNYRIPMSAFVMDFPEQLQFRFAYYTPVGSGNSAYGDGCAIDNFLFHRAQRSVDVGVLEILHPTQLSLGSTESLTVRLVNYGYDTIRQVPVAFRPYGSFLPSEEVFSGVIPPNGGEATFTFSSNSAFTVTSDYPENFTICAYTRTSSDLYHDNDTACIEYSLIPLEYDVQMIMFLAPGERAMAGDSVNVTVRFRNYGQNDIDSLPIAIDINNVICEETINFQNHLGRPLHSMEYFNYTFVHRFPISMGVMQMKVYSAMAQDSYRLNDTIVKRVEGITSITDLKAKEIVLNNRSVQLTVNNIGSQLAYGFTVGYFYDDDPENTVTQPYSGAISALSTGYVVFNTTLPARMEPYNRITAFVSATGDNDPSNDTTTLIVPATVDIRANKIFIEETRADSCRVRLQVENVGTFMHSGNFTISAVINGTSISTNSNRMIAPGEPYAIDYNMMVPKSPIRDYQGTGVFSSTYDVNEVNNQTTLIEVVNHFEGVPVVEEMTSYQLEQNYPNPFGQSTTIAFTIPQPSRVHFFVMDAMGHICYQSSQFYGAGRNLLQLSNAEMHLSSGVYFYGIECDGQRLMRKMILR